MACGSECNQEVGEALIGAVTSFCQNNQAYAGDPVNVVTGAFLHSEQDIAIPSQRLFIVLARHYNNQHHRSLPSLRLQPFGPGWSCNLFVRLERNEDGTYTFFDDRNAEVNFTRGLDKSSFVPPSGSLGLRLWQQADGSYHLRQSNGLTIEFDATGRVVALLQPGPKRDSRIDYAYDPQGRLTSVAGAGGRGLVLCYGDSDFLVREMRDHSGRIWRYTYNEHRELVGVCDPANRVRTYQYDQWIGSVAEKRKVSGQKTIRAMRSVFTFQSATDKMLSPALITNSYTSEGRVHLQLDSFGGQTRFEYNPFARTTAVTDPAGYTTLYCFDESGSTTKLRRPTGAITEYVFDDRRNLLAEIHPLGNTTEYVDFKDLGKLASAQELGRRAIGNRANYLRFAPDDIIRGYDADGNRPLMRDSIGQTTRFESFTAFGQPQQITLPDGAVIRTEYETRSGLPLKQIRPLISGREIPLRVIETWDYDDFGNCVRHCSWAEPEDQKGRRITPICVEAFEYDSETQQPLICRRWAENDREGSLFASEIRYSWDMLGRVVETVSFRRESADGTPIAAIRRFGYDIVDRRTWESFPDGTARVWEFDIEGNVIEEFQVGDASCESLPKVPIERRLRRRRSLYDAAGRIIESIDPADCVTIYKWDSCGRCASVLSASGQLRQFKYDPDGRLVAEITPSGNEIRIEYDAAGCLISRTDTLGAELYIQRDVLGRAIRVSSRKQPSQPATEYRYDMRGRINEQSFSDGTQENLTYDEFDNVISRTRGRKGQPPDSIELFEFDGIGRLVAVKAGGKESLILKYRYEYFNDRREVRVIDALGNMTQSHYDSEGSLIRRLDAEGRLLQFAYDLAGRLIRRWSVDGSVDSRYFYDCGDLLLRATEPDVEYAWDYDQAGRLIRHRQNVSGSECSVHYEYDTVGRISEKRLDDLWWVRYVYATSPLPSELIFPNNRVRLDYDAGNRLVKEQWPDEGLTEYQYTKNGSLAVMRSLDQAGSLKWEQKFEFDDRQRPVREFRSSGSNGSQLISYSHDTLNRLIDVKHGDGTLIGSCSFSYDQQENRTAVHRAGFPSTSYQYDLADRITDESSDGARRSYEYDRCGLLISDGSRAFQYDAAHRLRELTTSHAKVEFLYSANGELVSSKAGNCLERSYYDGQQEIVRHRPTDRQDIFWSVKPEFLMATRFNKLPVSRILTNAWGAILSSGSGEHLRDYDPFGAASDSNGVGIGFGFSSKRLESNSGLYFNRARFYDPLTGRFAQPDPKGLVDGPNLYRYGRNNPIVFEDTSGFEARPLSKGRIAELLLGLEFTSFPGQKDGRTNIVQPGFWEPRLHTKHLDAKGNLLGRSFVVNPGWFEARPHIKHFDANWNVVGRTYIKEPGLFESRPHAEHYDAKWNRLGRSYVVGPGWLESRPHIERFDANWELERSSYVVGPGLFESRSHLEHYDPNWGRVGRTYVHAPAWYESRHHFHHYA